MSNKNHGTIFKDWQTVPVTPLTKTNLEYLLHATRFHGVKQQLQSGDPNFHIKSIEIQS